MSNGVEIFVVVEGRTEQLFIQQILAPYLSYKNIWMKATQISKTGEKGGDVRFSRAKKDIGQFLKQRQDSFVSVFIDYYGIKEWPGLDEIRQGYTPHQISMIIRKTTMECLKNEFEDIDVEKRFIPFIMVHEFEALLFSDASVLSKELGIKSNKVDEVLQEFHDQPEQINNSVRTAPSKRLERWYPTYKKTVNGINIAGKIGIEKMRQKCPLFDAWLTSIEAIVS